MKKSKKVGVWFVHAGTSPYSFLRREWSYGPYWFQFQAHFVAWLHCQKYSYGEALIVHRDTIK